MMPALRNLGRTILASAFIVVVGVQFAPAVKPEPVEQVNVNSLIEKRIVPLGTLNGHTVYVTINDIVPHIVTGQRTAIVISHFFHFDEDSDEGSNEPGELERAIDQKLQTISRGESHKLKRLADNITDNIRKAKAGDVHEIILNIPEKYYTYFPVDRLYVVLFRGTSGWKINSQGLFRAMPNVIKRATETRISSLIVPAVGYHNMDKNSIPFEDIYRPLFRSLLVSTTPENVYIVLYEPWSTHVLEGAVKAINMEWTRIKSETR